MVHTLTTVKKRSTFVHIRDNGKFIRSQSFNIQILEDPNLDNIITVGYTATKRLGNAVIRNKSKRIMRELARKVIAEYGKINFCYVLIAKTTLLKRSFKEIELELKKILV